MKYLVFTESSPEDWCRILERDKPYQAERAVHPEKYPKYVMTTCRLSSELPRLTESMRGVDVYEVDSPEQLANHMASWDAQRLYAKTLKRWYVPLVEFAEPYTTEFFHQLELLEKTKEQAKTGE